VHAKATGQWSSERVNNHFTRPQPLDWRAVASGVVVQEQGSRSGMFHTRKMFAQRTLLTAQSVIGARLSPFAAFVQENTPNECVFEFDLLRSCIFRKYTRQKYTPS
jgi:hypothetical protein